MLIDKFILAASLDSVVCTPILYAYQQAKGFPAEI